MKPAMEILLRVRDYDLAATLDSGQAFRWQLHGDSWFGVVGRHSVCLTQVNDGIHAQTAGPVADWQWLRDYLQTGVDLDAVLKTFPDDAPMRDAVAACRGLRVLWQDPWECLASFILSSTKQIVQIRQIVALLCERFGEPIARPAPPIHQFRSSGRQSAPISHPRQCFGATQPALLRFGGSGLNKNHLSYSFPTAQHLATATEAELRACKMGFRAPHLLAAARQIADGQFDLERLRHLPQAEAREELMKLRGVGAKSPTACCCSPMALTARFRWMSGSNARCANFISRTAASAPNGFSTLPRRISARTPVTPSNIFFITCGRR